MLDVLPEGRHFLNPFFWSHEVHDMVRVEPGTCLVLTRKFGRAIPDARIAAGDLLASEDAANPIDGEAASCATSSSQAATASIPMPIPGKWRRRSRFASAKLRRFPLAQSGPRPAADPRRRTA